MADGPSVGINRSPVAITAADENENTIDIRLLDKLKPIGTLKVPNAARWHAAIVRIVLEKRALAVFVNGFRPRLKGRDFVGIFDVREKSIAVHGDFSAGLFDQHSGTRSTPIAFFPGRRPESHVTVGPAGSGLARELCDGLIRWHE